MLRALALRSPPPTPRTFLPDLYLLRKKCFISKRALSSQINHVSQLLCPILVDAFGVNLLSPLKSKAAGLCWAEARIYEVCSARSCPAFRTPGKPLGSVSWHIGCSIVGWLRARNASSNYDTFAMLLQIACLRHRLTTPFSASLERGNKIQRKSMELMFYIKAISKQLLGLQSNKDVDVFIKNSRQIIFNLCLDTINVWIL